MNKLKVAVVRGGPSAEHEISLLSAKSVTDNLDKHKYQLVDVYVSDKNEWSIVGMTVLNDDKAIASLKELSVDVVFLSVHGTYGEDGALQTKLEKAGLKFTGSGSEASATAFDKEKAQAIYEKEGLLVPKSLVIKSPEEKVGMALPFVVKPVAQGSSVGVSIVKVTENIEPSITLALKHDVQVMIQEYIDGREVSCGVLEIKGSLQALPPTELIPIAADFFDFEAKYTKGATNEITPPNMAETVIKQIQDIAIKAHKILGCGGYSRTDMIVRGKEIFVIETNTLPGLTETSILPQQAKIAGISFSGLLDHIIKAAK